MVAATGLQPCMELLFATLKMAGANFELQQERQAVRGEGRTFRVLEAARGTLMNNCCLKVHALMNQCPMALPSSMRTCAAKSTLFRVLSGLLCNLRAVVQRHHQGFPYLLFTLLDGPHHADLVYSKPKCFRDELATVFFERFPDVKAGTSEPALAFLQSLALMAETDACTDLGCC